MDAFAPLLCLGSLGLMVFALGFVVGRYRLVPRDRTETTRASLGGLAQNGK